MLLYYSLIVQYILLIIQYVKLNTSTFIIIFSIDLAERSIHCVEILTNLLPLPGKSKNRQWKQYI